MANMLGMDIEQVKTVAREVEREAADLQTKINSIGTKIQGAQWKGPDRERFMGDWNSQKAQVMKVVEMLKKTAADMKKNAAEQEATSNR
jgi:uncharacterized protein YukE